VRGVPQLDAFRVVGPRPVLHLRIARRLKLTLEFIEEVVHPSGQVRQFVIVDTDRLRPCIQGVANGSARLGQCVGCRLRGTAGTVLQALPATPKVAERLVWYDQAIAQALEGLDEVRTSRRWHH